MVLGLLYPIFEADSTGSLTYPNYSENNINLNSYNTSGFNNEIIFGLNVDYQDNIIVSGGIFNEDFTSGDAYLSKISPRGSILWTIFLEGLGGDGAFGTAIDADDNIIITVDTNSEDLPLIRGDFEYQREFRGGGLDTYVAKVSPEGNIIWSTYLGGSGWDQIGGAVLDSKDNIYFYGDTSSQDFPLLHSMQNNISGSSGDLDHFITKFSENGKMQWSTYFGGSQPDTKGMIRIDSQDNILFSTQALSTNFPVIESLNHNHKGLKDIYFAKLNSSIPSVIWGSYLGGASEELIGEITIDSYDRLHITGSTASSNFTTTSDAFKEFKSGSDEDGFYSKFSSNGKLMYSTYFGGISNGTIQQRDAGKAIAIDGFGSAVITGVTRSQDFPVTNNAIQSEKQGDPQALDCILIEFSAEGELEYSSYFGGETSEDCQVMAIDVSNNRIVGSVVGEDFGVVNAQFKYSFGGEIDAGLSKFNLFNELVWSHRSVVVTERDQDLDHDGLTNQEEYDNKSDPRDSDTDSDEIPDGWEVSNGLDPTDSDDSGIDIDQDGLSNLQEFTHQTNPNQEDTDGDKMDDGYEVAHGLNPLENDSSGDKDNDGLPNGLEYNLGFLGFRSDKSLDTIIYAIILLLLLIFIISYTIIYFRRNRTAIEKGFDNHAERIKVNKYGFDDKNQFIKAHSKGFLTKDAYQSAQLLGFDDIDSILDTWNNMLNTMGGQIGGLNPNNVRENLDSIKSPFDLKEYRLSFNRENEDLFDLRKKLNSYIVYTDKILEFNNQEGIFPLVNIDPNRFKTYHNRFYLHFSELHTKLKQIAQLFQKKEVWFSPWESLLSFIKVTEEGSPVSITQISEIIGFDPDHVEKILNLILMENEIIGIYDSSTKEYTKGLNVQGYIKIALEKFGEYIENEKSGNPNPS